MDDQAEKLFERVQEGDPDAAQEVFDRYCNQLVRLARGKLSAKLGRRVDAEDIVQSALRSFFVHAREGRYEIHHSGELWRLLAKITINKVHQNVERHTAIKRGIAREQSVRNEDNSTIGISPITREPSADEALALIEEVEKLTVGLDEVQMQIVQLRLQGYQIAEIAERVQRAERTVRRVMDKVKTRLEARVAEQLNSGSNSDKDESDKST